jgi:hypothetical protein
MLTDQATLLAMTLKAGVSLRVKRGNPLGKMHFFYEITY